MKMSALSAFAHLSSELIYLYALDLKSECTYDCVSLFLDMFDSMPEQSPTTESKAATTPSVDLFGAGTGVDIHFSVCGTSSSLLVSIPPLLCQLFFSPHTSWFVPHSGMRTVHVTHSSNLGLSLWLLSIPAVFLPATLILFFAPQPPRFSSFSCSASRLRW